MTPHALHTAGLIALFILSVISTGGAIHLAIAWAWSDDWRPRDQEESCEP